nr:immunoglobulin heavy chain junction region [Mus musculus]
CARRPIYDDYYLDYW